MQTFILISLLVLIVGLVAAVYYIAQLQKNLQPDQNREQLLHQRLDSLTQHVSTNLNDVTKNVLQQLSQVTTQVNDRLKENTVSLERSHRTIGERLDNAAKSYTVVTNKLATLEESNKKIYDIGKDIASLQEILRAPKLRGTLGELFLGDLLAQTFPKDNYDLQYTFKSGQKIDAVLRLNDNSMVPIDAKFPLENFKKMIQASDDNQRKILKKIFLNDVKKHISDIAEKYILPDEGTIDFALMYIPAENVYYEMIIKDADDLSLMNFAFLKKVIPVSPNTFYIYLQSIMLGLKGWKIQQEAKQIWQHLGQLQQDVFKFSEQFSLLGKHLNHATNTYGTSDKHLNRLSDKLAALGTGQTRVLETELVAGVLEAGEV